MTLCLNVNTLIFMFQACVSLRKCETRSKPQLIYRDRGGDFHESTRCISKTSI